MSNFEYRLVVVNRNSNKTVHDKVLFSDYDSMKFEMWADRFRSLQQASVKEQRNNAQIESSCLIVHKSLDPSSLEESEFFLLGNPEEKMIVTVPNSVASSVFLQVNQIDEHKTKEGLTLDVHDIFPFLINYYNQNSLVIHGGQRGMFARVVLQNKVPPEMRVFMWMVLSGADKKILDQRKDFEVKPEVLKSIDYLAPYFEEVAKSLQNSNKSDFLEVKEWAKTALEIFSVYWKSNNISDSQQDTSWPNDHKYLAHFLVPMVKGYQESHKALFDTNKKGETMEKLRKIHQEKYVASFESKGFKNHKKLSMYVLAKESFTNLGILDFFCTTKFEGVFNSFAESMQEEDKELFSFLSYVLFLNTGQARFSTYGQVDCPGALQEFPISRTQQDFSHQYRHDIHMHA